MTTRIVFIPFVGKNEYEYTCRPLLLYGLSQTPCCESAGLKLRRQYPLQKKKTKQKNKKQKKNTQKKRSSVYNNKLQDELKVES